MRKIEPVTTIVSELIKDLRFDANMTQSELAEAISSTREYISLVENCERRITLASLERIATGLSIPLSSLLTQLAKRLRA